MKIDEVYLSFDGGIVLNLKMPLSARKELEPIIDTIDTFNPELDYVLSLKKATKPRSLTANAYMWVLCDQIARVVKTTKEEVYRKAIKEVGVFSDVGVQAGEPCAELVKAWGSNGIGYFSEMFDSALTDKDGNKMKRVRLYVGSHNYSSKDISRLIDYVVDEAKNLGLETMTPKQIEELKAVWKG